MRDEERLGAQFKAVRDLMLPGCWWTLRELAGRTGASEASVSARIRDLRKARFGGHRVERRRVEGGLFEYRVRGEP